MTIEHMVCSTNIACQAVAIDQRISVCRLGEEVFLQRLTIWKKKKPSEKLKVCSSNWHLQNNNNNGHHHYHTHSFIQAIFIAPFQVHYYSEVLSTQHGYCVGVSRRSATGNCK